MLQPQKLPSTQIIIAALNEEQGIGLTIAELQDYLPHPSLLVIDGRSTDKTVEIAKNLGAEILIQDGTGKGDAIAKAIDHLDPNVEYVIVTDADYTYPAKYVPKMIKLLQQSPKVGMICGNRFTDDLEKEALHNVFYVGNRLIAFTHNLLNGVQLVDPLTGLRVIRSKILRDWRVQSKGFDIEVELNHHVERMGYGILEVPITYRERMGQKKLRVVHGQEIFKRMFLELIRDTKDRMA